MVDKQKTLKSIFSHHWFLAVIVSACILFSSIALFPSNAGAIEGCDGEAAPDATGACILDGKPTGQKVEPAAGGGDQEEQGGQDSAEEETCAIDKIGWILCPIIESAATISDKAFDILADNFLRTDPQLFKDDSGTKQAWEYARNVANIMFIIAFLIIIFAQVTGRGLNNYHIKKMLPRLVIAAIAVNISYYICQLAVDATNIFGYEIQNALASISNELGPSVLGDASKYGATEKGNGILSVIAWGALGAAGVIWLILAPLGSIILFVLITVLSIIIILLLRKALIVLLIVISPIAFVMYLLPNTEKFFNKWMSMFGKLLMVFPVVALLFGAGQLASTIIIVSGTQNTADVKLAEECKPDNKEDPASKKYNEEVLQKNPAAYNNCGGGAITLNTTSDGEKVCERGGQANCKEETTISWMLGLVAMGIAVAPLIGVWAVLKGALSATGAIGGKIGTTIGNMNSGARGRMQQARKESGEYRRNRLQGRALQGDGVGDALNAASLGGFRRSARRKARHDYAKSELSRSQTEFVASNAIDENGQPTRFGRSLAGGILSDDESLQRVAANAINAQHQLELDNVKAAHATVDTMDQKQIVEALEKSNDSNNAQVAAMLERLVQVGEGHQLEKYANKFAQNGPSLASRSLGSALSSNNPGYLKGSDIDNISRGQLGGSYLDENGTTQQVGTFDTMAATNLAAGILSQEKMAAAAPSHLKYAQQLAANQAQNNHPEALQQLRSTANALLSNDRLKGSIGRNADTLRDIAR